MAANRPKTDASTSALGYLYQCRFALYHVLKGDDGPNRYVSIEKLDDVALTDLNSISADISNAELFQLKHHIERKGGTSNSHTDIWKTLKIWSQAILDKVVEVEDARFFMITTSVASNSHAIRNLRSNETRNSDKARGQLELAGANSKNDKVQEAFKVLNKLGVRERKKLFARIYLIDDSPDIVKIRSKLEKAVWQAVNSDQAPAFVERLEGWWFNCVIQHLFDPMSHRIPVELVRDQVHCLREEFMSDNLPADLLTSPVPSPQQPGEDQRVFVRQLSHVGVGENRIRKAQENHYRAVAQRAKWLRSHLLHISELEQFEQKLEQEWDEFYQMMLDDLDENATDPQLNKAARDLYKWSQATAPDKQSLFIRPRFQAPYFTRGSYQMLADQLRIGWHRDFLKLFSDKHGNG